MANMRPEGVRQLGEVWTQAGEGLHGQAKKLSSPNLTPEAFGSHYAAHAAGIPEAFDRIATTWSGWGDHCNGYSTNLHGVADSYNAVSNDADAG